MLVNHNDSMPFQTVFQGQYLLGQNETFSSYLKPFEYNFVMCRLIQICVYFFWISTCTWSFIEAFQIIYNFHFKMFEIGSEIWHLLLFGWGLPVVTISGWYLCIHKVCLKICTIETFFQKKHFKQL